MRFGIALPDLTPSQLSYNVITKVNAHIKQHPEDDIIAFVENIEKHCLPASFAVMDMMEIWGYVNPVIATSLSTAEKILNCPSTTRALFYCWDLWWIRQERKQWELIQPIYGHKNLEVMVRSQEHADIYEQCWNKKVTAVIDDFDIQKIGDIIARHP